MADNLRVPWCMAGCASVPSTPARKPSEPSNVRCHAQNRARVWIPTRHGEFSSRHADLAHRHLAASSLTDRLQRLGSALLIDHGVRRTRSAEKAR